MRNPIETDISRILIIALGDMGDIVLKIAAFEAIRNYHKNAHICLITEGFMRRFLEDCPYIDEIVTNHRADNFRDNLTVTNALQKAKFELVYDLSQTTESNEIYKKFWISRPKWSGNAPNCSHSIENIASESNHPLDFLAAQLWQCGIGPEMPYPQGAAPLPNLTWIIDAPNTDGFDLGIDSDFVLIAPEAPNGKPHFAWPVEKFVELGGLLSDKGLLPIIVGTNAASALGNIIRANIKNALDLVGRIDLNTFVRLAHNSKLMVSSNSDFAKIGAIAGAPLVTILNPEGLDLIEVAPRGSNCVTLVASDFEQIDVNRVLMTARAVCDLV